MIRTEMLFQQAMEFANMGGNVDFSTGGTRFQLPHLCVMEALQNGISIERITFSSDGHGGVRRFNPQTGEDSYRPAPLNLNFKEMKALVNECNIPLEQALKLMHLVSKGQIEVGKDADLCFLNNQLDITDVILNGEIGMKDQVIIKKGRYEK